MATKKGKKQATKSKAAKKAKRTFALARPKKASARKPKRGAVSKVGARKPAAKKKRAKAGSASKSKKSVASPPSRGGRAEIRRRDRPGHIDPGYADELRRQSGAEDEDPEAFLESPRSNSDDLAEERGEEVIEKATTGEDEAEDALDQVVPEEQGGPFVETNAGQEFGFGTDASNPKGAKREPFPTT